MASSRHSHLDVVHQTVQATSTPVAEQRHHTGPYSRPLETSAEHKGLPAEQPTAYESATPTNRFRMSTDVSICWAMAEFPGFFYCCVAKVPLFSYTTDRSLLDENSLTYGCVGRLVSSRALQVQLLAPPEYQRMTRCSMISC